MVTDVPGDEPDGAAGAAIANPAPTQGSEGDAGAEGAAVAADAPPTAELLREVMPGWDVDARTVERRVP